MNDDDGEIDLGDEPEGYQEGGIIGAPLGGGVAPPREPIYPSVMLSGNEKLAKIPDTGRSLINHSVVSRRVHTPQHGKHKGKTRHEVEIRLHKIKPIRGYKKAPSKSKRADDEVAMEQLMGGTEEV